MANCRRIVFCVTFTCWLLCAIAIFVTPVSAHEEYVAEEEYDVAVGPFLAQSLTDPLVIGPLAAGGIVALSLIGVYLRFLPVQRDVNAFRRAMREYEEYVPWLLRIAFGIPLIGAGFSGYFFSPALEIELRILQVALGFGLLFGLATRLLAFVTLLTYLLTALIWPIVLLQLEFVGGLLAIMLIGPGKPSADHTFQRLAGEPGSIYGRIDPVYERARSFQTWIDPYESYLPTVTRLGLGVTFIYLGASQKILRPGLALAVVDQYDLTAVVPVQPELWVLGAGFAEITLGIALIAGVFTRTSAGTAISIFVLTLFALPDDPVLAHVGLFGMASVLLITGGGPGSVDRWLSSRFDTYERRLRSDHGRQ